MPKEYKKNHSNNEPAFEKSAYRSEKFLEKLRDVLYYVKQKIELMAKIRGKEIQNDSKEIIAGKKYK